MESVKVNNKFDFFLIRFFLTILLCSLTLILTGRIADNEFLLGNLEYGVSGTSNALGQFIFSRFAFINNIYLLIAFFTGFNSLLLIIILNKFIDKENKFLWIVFLLSPGLLIYTNAPTKETLFFYPAILFIILEVKFLLSKHLQIDSFLLNIFARLGLLGFMFAMRGDLSLPYILLFFISLIFKNFYFGVIKDKLNINRLLLISLIISIFINYLLTLFSPEYFENLLNYLFVSFETSKDLYRPTINLDFVSNPINSIQIQYLALFPTPNELLSKPYKAVIIIDSLLLIYAFIKSWRILFKVINSFKILKKIIMLFFIYVSCIYFSIFGLIGSFNLGSSQRLRINYFPIGIIFPLILEKEIRNLQKKKLFHS